MGDRHGRARARCWCSAGSMPYRIVRCCSRALSICRPGFLRWARARALGPMWWTSGWCARTGSNVVSSDRHPCGDDRADAIRRRELFERADVSPRERLSEARVRDRRDGGRLRPDCWAVDPSCSRVDSYAAWPSVLVYRSRVSSYRAGPLTPEPALALISEERSAGDVSPRISAGFDASGSGLPLDSSCHR